jgi:release factor glutamine methyltransferase
VQQPEPRGALVSGGDGAADLRQIIRSARSHLPTAGTLALETGIAQHATLAEELRGAGFIHVESLPDLTGRDRFLLAS